MLAAYTPYHTNNVLLHFSALEVKGAESTRHRESTGTGTHTFFIFMPLETPIEQHTFLLSFGKCSGIDIFIRY